MPPPPARPWIKSVKILQEDVRLSRWTLSTHQFGRDWEFSWLARNLAPIKNQKIHWVSEPGSTSMGKRQRGGEMVSEPGSTSMGEAERRG